MDDPSDSQDDPTGVLIGAEVLLATGVVLGLGVLLVWFAVLRENQDFWTNAGGYPIWLRDMVQWTYLPLFAAAGIALSVLSVACCAKVCGSIRFFVLESLVLLVCWGLLATSGYIAFNNNFINLIHGRDVHYHGK